MKNQLLLLEDVDDVGRSGDLVSVKPGFARNFLLPQKKAVVAGKFTLRLRARLQEERGKRAEVDKQEADALSQQINEMTLDIEVKVDPDGHMYGSVTIQDIIRLFEEQGIKLERRNVLLLHPIKALGAHKISLKLKEGVPASFTLNVNSDVPLKVQKKEAVKETAKEQRQEEQPQ